VLIAGDLADTYQAQLQWHTHPFHVWRRHRRSARVGSIDGRPPLDDFILAPDWGGSKNVCKCT